MDLTEKEAMFRDILLQIIVFLLFVFTFLYLYGIPQSLFHKFRYRTKSSATQSKLHFVKAAQLLDRARSSKSLTGTTAAAGLAEEALTEADLAISLNPKDAAPYLLKAMALEFQGFRTSALESIDMALSPLAAKSLEESERGDALLKRAELKKAMKAESVVEEDLTQVVKLNPGNVKGWFLLGEWYEGKKMEDEAKKAYEKVLELEPELRVAKEALKRLGSGSSS
ncbi:hypothetical protein RIF29_12014 [Crotalaria pallida]|uniref:Uncharacterized protein n=1 Tax=Crotalaria pallida TaxID=3830 RepID=A0AAN9P0K7_CROPI